MKNGKRSFDLENNTLLLRTTHKRSVSLSAWVIKEHAKGNITTIIVVNHKNPTKHVATLNGDEVDDLILDSSPRWVTRTYKNKTTGKKVTNSFRTPYKVGTF
jgi:hypothetical protein